MCCVLYSRVPFTATLVNMLCDIEALFQHESAKVNICCCYVLLTIIVNEKHL